MLANDFNLITIEVVSTANPLHLNTSSFSEIGGVVIQDFAALESPPNANKPYISLVSNNIRGSYDEKGMGIPVLKTVAPESNGLMYRFKGGDHEGDVNQWVGSGMNTTIEFIWRGEDRQQGELISFTKPYLLNINLLAK